MPVIIGTGAVLADNSMALAAGAAKMEAVLATKLSYGCTNGA